MSRDALLLVLLLCLAVAAGYALGFAQARP